MDDGVGEEILARFLHVGCQGRGLRRDTEGKGSGEKATALILTGTTACKLGSSCLIFEGFMI